ncbi:hypothetical protein COV24_04530 [candidate division WWE3 bacterium CG10_big_fil_rev_8_21_14_0_10_32_10]|uniref:Uncharacterized protein n=1 Tax=candidate division WWE3 bacterium CG10_big_fil_rev_8_21_14_0_10_32_10 TaxID=1975090 RepID=A0A2H0R967_UNCKA|nr:MAG: hypothetical protein COV24_04530 [candidate division WWE3 bacterium CG10_big_fil_rev_8_21_14_0_10_32_10]
MKLLNNHWKIILVVTFFNILAEYSLRGIGNLQAIPLLPFALFLNYFSYFVVLEYLITKYHLRDYHLAVIALFYGLLWQLIGPSIVYLAPFFLGLNWVGIIFVNFIWWVPIQTILAFYLANRLFKRDYTSSFLSEGKYTFFIGLFIVATLLFRIIAPLPVTIIGLFVMILLTGISYWFSKRILDKLKTDIPSIRSFEKNIVYDIFSFGLILYFIYAAVLIEPESGMSATTHLNLKALQIGIRVSTIVVILLFTYRKFSKKPISV